MATFSNLDNESPYDLVAGVRGRAMIGDALMLNLIELDPNSEVPLHSHPHEQMGYVLAGEINLIVEGVDHWLRPGDAFQVPGGVEHAAKAGASGCRALDVFHPVREDYRDRIGA
jgi:quercetin dioxygenase-like cupin family protein